MTFGSIDIALNIQVVILLLLVGAAIKHLKFLDKVANEIIPVILIVIGIICAIVISYPISSDNIIVTLIEGLASAITAVGIHSAGRNIFANGTFASSFADKFLGKKEDETKDE
ncbi:MAG: phage holin family protein [Candidatus Izemoplasmatales bacterium]|nr:phage holin family protein [Candidatus Izemoplasmatales bacterium]